MNTNCSAGQFSAILLILVLCCSCMWWLYSSRQPRLYNEPFEATVDPEAWAEAIEEVEALPEMEELAEAEDGGPLGPAGCLARGRGGAEVPFVNAQTGTLLDGPGFESAAGLGTGDANISGAAEIPTTIPSDYYFLDDGANGEMRVENNLFSPSCCGAQWPVPGVKTGVADGALCGNGPFVPNRMFGQNSYSNSGCLCLSQKQATHLYNRGGNGREWF